MCVYYVRIKKLFETDHIEKLFVFMWGKKILLLLHCVVIEKKIFIQA